MFDIVELVRFFRFTCEIRKMVRINGSSSNSSFLILIIVDNYCFFCDNHFPKKRNKSISKSLSKSLYEIRRYNIVPRKVKRKTCEFRNWILFVGLYDEGTVRRRVAVDRSGIDINEGNDLTKIQSGKRTICEMLLSLSLLSYEYRKRNT